MRRVDMDVDGAEESSIDGGSASLRAGTAKRSDFMTAKQKFVGAQVGLDVQLVMIPHLPLP